MALRAPSVRSPVVEKIIIEEPLPSKATASQSTVTCVYQANIAGFWRNVTILWCKNLMHSLNIKIDSAGGDSPYNCKIDFKPWPFWGKKGYKSFEVDHGGQVEVYWDLRSAKYSGGPEPCSDFYVALVSEEEVVLLLGDNNNKAYKRTKSRPAPVEAILYHKKENVFAKKSFTTRAKFEGSKKDSDIVVESSTSGPKDPEMWISVDGIVLIHVKNLQWKFRGNKTVMVNQQPVQVFWDVYDWMFSDSGTGSGLFVFKPGPQDLDNDKESSCTIDDGDASSGYYSTVSSAVTPEFCLLLHAFKIE